MVHGSPKACASPKMNELKGSAGGYVDGFTHRCCVRCINARSTLDHMYVRSAQAGRFIFFTEYDILIGGDNC